MRFSGIDIELTNICDMGCVYCPNSIKKRTKEHMRFELYTKIIDEIVSRDITGTVILYGVGESLLYPNLLDAIRYATKKGLATHIYTNGLALTSELYRKMVDSGLKLLEISFHDLSPEAFAYRYVKRPVSYNAFYENVISVINYHIGHGITNPLLISAMFSKKHWISSQLWGLSVIEENTINAIKLLTPFIEETRKIAEINKQKYYLNPAAIRRAIQALRMCDSRLLRITENVQMKITSLNPRIFRTRQVLQGEPEEKIKLVKKTQGKCRGVLLNKPPLILSDGSFVPCSMDDFGDLIMGKITEDVSLMAILKGEKYQKFRDDILSGRLTHSLCQECRGELRYKNPVEQTIYRLKDFSLYGIQAAFIDKTKSCIKRFLKRM